MSVLEDVLLELWRQGFRRVAVLNWHMENTDFTYEAAPLAIEHARLDDAQAMVHDDPAGAPRSNDGGALPWRVSGPGRRTRRDLCDLADAPSAAGAGFDGSRG